MKRVGYICLIFFFQSTWALGKSSPEAGIVVGGKYQSSSEQDEDTIEAHTDINAGLKATNPFLDTSLNYKLGIEQQFEPDEKQTTKVLGASQFDFHDLSNTYGAKLIQRSNYSQTRLTSEEDDVSSSILHLFSASPYVTYRPNKSSRITVSAKRSVTNSDLNEDTEKHYESSLSSASLSYSTPLSSDTRLGTSLTTTTTHDKEHRDENFNSAIITINTSLRQTSTVTKLGITQTEIEDGPNKTADNSFVAGYTLSINQKLSQTVVSYDREVVNNQLTIEQQSSESNELINLPDQTVVTDKVSFSHNSLKLCNKCTFLLKGVIDTENSIEDTTQTSSYSTNTKIGYKPQTGFTISVSASISQEYNDWFGEDISRRQSTSLSTQWALSSQTKLNTILSSVNLKDYLVENQEETQITRFNINISHSF